MLATVGEFWMIGYLLIKGVREQGSADGPARERCRDGGRCALAHAGA